MQHAACMKDADLLQRHFCPRQQPSLHTECGSQQQAGPHLQNLAGVADVAAQLAACREEAALPCLHFDVPCPASPAGHACPEGEDPSCSTHSTRSAKAMQAGPKAS